jgi:hypothetical protein
MELYGSDDVDHDVDAAAGEFVIEAREAGEF